MGSGFVVAAIVCAGVGLVLLIIGIQSSWRAYRAASRRATELSVYALEEATALEQLSARLNQHGFDLEHTTTELFPKIARVTAFLERPVVAAAIPWLLRRAFRRPYRRR